MDIENDNEGKEAAFLPSPTEEESRPAQDRDSQDEVNGDEEMRIGLGRDVYADGNGKEDDDNPEPPALDLSEEEVADSAPQHSSALAPPTSPITTPHVEDDDASFSLPHDDDGNVGAVDEEGVDEDDVGEDCAEAISESTPGVLRAAGASGGEDRGRRKRRPRPERASNKFESKV